MALIPTEQVSRVKKAVPVTSRGGLKGCEMLRILHFLANWLTDAGEVVSLMPLPPRKILGTHFCYRLGQPPGAILLLEGLGTLRKLNDLIEFPLNT
jgi:hypothetical protein